MQEGYQKQSSESAEHKRREDESCAEIERLKAENIALEQTVRDNADYIAKQDEDIERLRSAIWEALKLLPQVCTCACKDCPAILNCAYMILRKAVEK
jgi:hypothetical protein